MGIKCDSCVCKVLTDETNTSLGFIYICNVGYWSGECEDLEREGYYTFRDKCPKYKNSGIVHNLKKV